MRDWEKSRVKKICLCCKKKFIVVLSIIKKGHGKYCSKKCYDKKQIGQRNSPKTEFKKGHIAWSKIHKNLMPRREEVKSWKGGRRVDNRGYVFILKHNHPYSTPRDGYVREHRLVMEKYLGRYLDPKEVVHHINNIKNDNRIENLMLFKSQWEHNKFHKSSK